MPEGVKHEDVAAIRREIETTVDSTTAQLRKIEALAQQRLHEAAVEQQHLQNFLDELHYRLEFLARSRAAGEDAHILTGPLTEEQLTSKQDQEEALEARLEDLQATNTELEQLSTRTSWLIHQIQGASEWVLSGSSKPAGANGAIDPQAAVGEQAMLAQIIMGQEAERARLAREIHDGPAQALANTVMRLQWVEKLHDRDPQQAGAEIARLRAAVQESLADVRRFIFNMRPASLADVGLVATLRHYVRDWGEQYEIQTELNVPDTLNLSQDQELVVFRIIQEALQNIHKHAQATEVTINLQQRRGGPLAVTVTDNGQGFNPKLVRQIQPSSSGLVNMRERAATVGGTLQIDSKPGAGTTITLVVPMPRV